MIVVQTLLKISAYAAAVFLILLLFRRIFQKKLSPALMYALWFVLIARLLLPVTLEGGVRLFTLPQQVQAGTFEVVFSGESTVSSANAQTATDGETSAKTPSVLQTAASSAVRSSNWWTAALIVYLAGAVTAGGWMIVSYAMLRRGIRRDAAEPAERLYTLLRQTKAELGVRGNIRLVCAYACGAPAMVFPRILFLPLGALVSMRDEEIKNVLRHELTHHKRGDPAVSVLLAALCAVYWFNPVVWIAARLMRADMESACDATVTRRFARDEKEDYASLLLSLYALPALGAPALSLSGRGVARQAEKRVRGVFDAKKSGAWTKIAALAMTLALAFGCFTTACQPVSGTSGHTFDRDNPWISDVPVTAVEHIDRESEILQKNLTFTVDADVTVPKTYEQAIVSIERRSIDYAAFQALLKAVMPEVEWTAMHDEAETDMTASGERDGETYTAFCGTSSDGVTYFSIYPKDVCMVREGYFANDNEMEQDYAEQIHTPIKTTAAEARPLADAVVEALGAEGMMLQSAERACRFGTAVYDDSAVLTRGWCFVYVPSCGGLPAYYRGGGASYGGASDYYGTPLTPVLSVYVDENGVSLVDCRDLFTVAAVDAYSEPLLSFEDALESTRQLLKDCYADQGLNLPLNVTVTAVQLAASCVSNERMSESAALDYTGENGNVVPVWEVICTFYGGSVYNQTVAFRFTATDGVALMQQF